MGLIRWLSEQRDRQITEHARPHLDDDEQVVHWLRIRHPHKRREGFAYITERKYIVRWVGKRDGHRAISWADLESWAVDTNAEHGPEICVESRGESTVVQVPVTSEGSARRASDFMSRFATLAPRPRWRTTRSGTSGTLPADGDMGVSVRPKSVAGKTRRLVVTFLGVSVIVVGVFLLVLPGPGILVVIAGFAVLASEYDWAKDALVWLREKYRQTRGRMKQRRSASHDL